LIVDKSDTLVLYCAESDRRERLCFEAGASPGLNQFQSVVEPVVAPSCSVGGAAIRLEKVWRRWAAVDHKASLSRTLKQKRLKKDSSLIVQSSQQSHQAVA
jgi:hypothetical protein